MNNHPHERKRTNVAYARIGKKVLATHKVSEALDKAASRRSSFTAMPANKPKRVIKWQYFAAAGLVLILLAAGGGWMYFNKQAQAKEQQVIQARIQEQVRINKQKEAECRAEMYEKNKNNPALKTYDEIYGFDTCIIK